MEGGIASRLRSRTRKTDGVLPQEESRDSTADQSNGNESGNVVRRKRPATQGPENKNAKKRKNTPNPPVMATVPEVPGPRTTEGPPPPRTRSYIAMSTGGMRRDRIPAAPSTSSAALNPQSPDDRMPLSTAPRAPEVPISHRTTEGHSPRRTRGHIAMSTGGMRRDLIIAARPNPPADPGVGTPPPNNEHRAPDAPRANELILRFSAGRMDHRYVLRRSATARRDVGIWTTGNGTTVERVAVGASSAEAGRNSPGPARRQTIQQIRLEHAQEQRYLNSIRVELESIHRRLRALERELDERGLRIAANLTAGEIARLPTRLFDPSNGGDSRHTQCLVCLSEYEPGDRLRILGSCVHVFHSVCIDTWLENSATCPTCRTPVTVPRA